MCGIAGIAGPAAEGSTAEAMAAALDHRGPDSSGLHHDGDTWLAHKRLSIIDLKTGDQPMASHDRRLWLVYNGEIYNFRELRSQLRALGHRFTTESDSEVLLEGYRAWGFDLFAKLDGMFAFALWDAERRRLILVRDAFGIKPLHYSFDGSTLRFASEIKAILQDRAVRREVDFHALHSFMNLRYIPGERTLFSGIKRLLAGHFLVFEDGYLSTRRFFDWSELDAEKSPPLAVEDYAEGIRHHLSEAVRKQLVSDVPLGVYLSGGLDSSSLVAMMREQTTGPIPTFTLGFGEPTDELADARVVSRHFATDHHELVIDPEPLRHFPAVIWATEEPKENVIQGYLLARFASRRVKAVHGGLGGDELFSGYNIHRFLRPTHSLHHRVPKWFSERLLSPISQALYSAQNATGMRRWDQYRRGLQLLTAIGDPSRFYLILRNAWDFDPGAYRLYGPAWRHLEPETTTSHFSELFRPRGPKVLEQALRAELRTKMVDDFLLNEDRNSMAHGLEVRVPFLDRDLVRFAMGIPVEWKMPGQQTKWLFRQAMAPLLPAPTVTKKKLGFHFDSLDQFRKDLRPVANRLLTRDRVEQRGWFDYRFLREIMDHKPHPRLRWHYYILWLAVGLEIWAQMFLEGDVANPDLDLEAYMP